MVSGCFLPDDSSHTPGPPIAVVQQVVLAPVAMAADATVTLPIPTIASTDPVVLVIVAGAGSDGGLAGVHLGDTTMLLWHDDEPGCSRDVLTLASIERPTDASAITIWSVSPTTVEVAILELSSATNLTDTVSRAESFEHAAAPVTEALGGELVLSTVSACTASVQLAPSSFVSLGLTTPGADVAYALPADAQSMGAEWSFAGTASWASSTSVITP